jgi:hypothetical protein
MDIATSRNDLSKNGTRASRPHAIVDLLARKQSEVWRFFTRVTVSLWNSAVDGAAWKYK